jgi:RimJ/RimL family protein N-acetyltransferase
MSWQPHRDRKETEQFLRRVERERRRGGSFTWAVYRGKTFCGLAALIAVTRTHRALRYDRAELAYWLRPEAQGRGLMTEAGEAVIAHAFDVLGLRRLVASHVPENEASRRVIERWGFRFIGRAREVYRKDGRWFDQCLYELLKADRRGGGAQS